MATAHNPKTVPQALPKSLITKIGALSRSRIAEVEDFVDFIAQKDGEQALTRAAAAASAPAFAVWNNSEDDVYDAI